MRISKIISMSIVIGMIFAGFAGITSESDALIIPIDTVYIGGTGYPDLGAALAAANPGDVLTSSEDHIFNTDITLTDVILDFTGTITIAAPWSMTFDNSSYYGDDIIVEAGAKLIYSNSRHTMDVGQQDIYGTVEYWNATVVTGNITVHDGAVLYVNSTNVTMNCTTMDLEYGIQVNATAAMYITDNGTGPSLINSTNFQYFFKVLGSNSMFSVENSTIMDCGALDADQTNWGPVIYSDNAFFYGSTFTDNYIGLALANSTGAYVIDCNVSDSTVSGLAVMHADNATIMDSTFSYNEITGLYVYNSTHIVADDNFCHNNNGLGAHFNRSDNSTFSNNTVEDNQASYSGMSFLLEWTNYTTVERNNFTTNVGYQLMVYYSYENDIQFNNITGAPSSTDGIFVYLADNNTLLSNNISGMDDGGESGISLFDANWNTIAGNNLSSNDFGLQLDAFSTNDNNYIVANIFYENGLTNGGNGLVVSSPAGGVNNIFWNMFMGNNLPHAADWVGLSNWDMGYPMGGNYWDDYAGVDNNNTAAQDVAPSDGIGDTPYAIGGGMGAMDNYPLMTFADANDNYAPSSAVGTITPSWNNTTPLNITATASDIRGSVDTVELWYSYEGAAYTHFENDTDGAPYDWNFTWPDGDGNYSFYSIAVDDSDNRESVPGAADATAGYDTTAPTVMVGANISTSTQISRDATAYDLMSGIVNYTWDESSSTIIWGSRWTEDTTIQAPSDGVWEIQLNVTDAVGNKGVASFFLTWDTTAPTVDAGTNVTNNVQFPQDATANDVTTSIANYTWSTLSGPGTITYGTQWTEDTTIEADTDGTYVIQLNVTDDVGNWDMDNFTLTWDTTAPTVDAGTNATTNVLFTQDATANDVTTSIANYTWSTLSGPGTITYGTQWTEDTTIEADTDGTYVIQLNVTDNLGYWAVSNSTLTWDTTAPNITVMDDVNANALFVQNATVNETLSGIASYVWTNVSGPGNVTFGNDSAEDTNITVTAEGIYIIQLNVTDNAGNWNVSTFKLTWDTTMPNVDAGANVTTHELFTQNATANDTLSGVSSYSWTKISGPGTITFGNTSAEDTNITADTDGVYVIRLKVTDSAGNSAVNNFTLTWDTTAPTVDAGANVSENALFTQNATASDTGTGILSYYWSKESGPGIITFGDASSEDTNITVNVDGTYIIQLMVTDNVGNWAVSNFTLTWDSTPPIVSSTTPVNDATGVAVNTTVTIVFSETMDTASVEDAITLMPADTIPSFHLVPADTILSYTWSGEDSIVEISSTANLPPNLTYTITITTTAMDILDNAIATNYVFSFTTWLDTDSDGTPDTTDLDDDGDGTNDTDDAFPLDENETMDTDEDGIGDVADTDDDGDGVLDVDDAFPTDDTETTDTDGDGTGDTADTDDDDDGVLDEDDAFPTDDTETTDTDGDGTGDTADTDDDGDGVLDEDDSNPLDASIGGIEEESNTMLYLLLVLLVVAAVLGVLVMKKMKGKGASEASSEDTEELEEDAEEESEETEDEDSSKDEEDNTEE